MIFHVIKYRLYLYVFSLLYLVFYDLRASCRFAKTHNKTDQVDVRIVVLLLIQFHSEIVIYVLNTIISTISSKH